MPKSTKDIPLESTNLFLFVGPADSGKSFAATSFGLKSKEFGGDDERPCYMLELDGRENALRGRPILYDSFTNEDGAIGVLNKLYDLRETCIKFGKAPFHTLIAPDSFTSFNDFAIADSLEVTEKQQDSGENKGRKRGQLTLLTVQDYGYEAEAIRKLLWECLGDLKKYCNVIVTAHETEYYKSVPTKVGEPTKTELAGYKILARDKIAAKLPYKFDEIYHFSHKEIQVSSRSIRRTVCFQDMLARSSYPELFKTTEKYDISNKEFYPFWKNLINQQTKGTAGK